MTVSLINKKNGEPSIELTNGNWFEILDIPGMERLIDTEHFCDSVEGNANTAQKMADLIANWAPLDKWGNGDPEFQERLKNRVVEFLRTCEGFYTY
ncbi:hypothetical protein Xbed_03477 [Xenorhabdus beddingii]|uniref:Uncharacterized protein n=1 Tax=Xenorhabdus beddingii TaxID=40578 RepID=A0A1Y2SCT1_9GAMM|nr:hypothetical protein [Xenorhabdus beddingii]OTA16550.1 hypothetical protein Xbed_03477 [Xenorhabdus beddingii]